MEEKWFENAREGYLDNMKNIYKIMKEKGIEEYVKEWRDEREDEGMDGWEFTSTTILIEATRHGRPNVVRWLLHELKVDVNEQNSHPMYYPSPGEPDFIQNSDTALHIAARNNQIECARLLLDAGSQHLENEIGSTPLEYAKHNEEMQDLIRSHFQLI